MDIKFRNQHGFAPIVIATIMALLILGGALVYLYLNMNKPKPSTPELTYNEDLPGYSSASPTTNAELYDKHREKIQKDLNLSDVQFEILKKTVDE